MSSLLNRIFSSSSSKRSSKIFSKSDVDGNTLTDSTSTDISNSYVSFNDTAKKEGKPVTFVINPDMEECKPEELVHSQLSEDFFMSSLLTTYRDWDKKGPFRQRLVSPGIGQNKAESHGLVGIVHGCYNLHIPFVLSPDDIWIAIMTQFSFWMKDNARRVRSHFVSFPESDGKKQLTVELGESNANEFDQMVAAFQQACDANIKYKEFAAWANPTFSTTTQVEKTIYGGIIMASLSEYFSFVATTRCGIPRVVVRGNRSDWEQIILRIEKLKSSFGLKSWANQLTHVVEKILETYDGKGDREFWNRIVSRHNRGSGKTYISGWITVFNRYDCRSGKEVETVKLLGGGYKDFPVFHVMKMVNGYAEVDVKVEDPSGGHLFDAQMILGIVGMNHDKKHNAVAVGRGWGWGSCEPLRPVVPGEGEEEDDDDEDY